MELALLVWAADVLPSIAAFVIFLCISVLAVSAVAFMNTACSSYINDKEVSKLSKHLCIISLVILLLAFLVPSKNTIYLMTGAYMTQSVYESEVGKKIVRILEIKMEEALVDMEKKSKK